jgi:hypothetical protein
MHRTKLPSAIAAASVVSGSPQQTDSTPLASLTYEDIVPILERFTIKKPVSDTPSGYAAFLLCDVDIRQLHTDREKVAYFAVIDVIEAGQAPQLTPFVEEPRFPAGVWNRPEVEAVMRPAVERAKKELQELR